MRGGCCRMGGVGISQYALGSIPRLPTHNAKYSTQSEQLIRPLPFVTQNVSLSLDPGGPRFNPQVSNMIHYSDESCYEA